MHFDLKRKTALVAATAAIAIAGCGGGDELSEEDYATEVGDILTTFGEESISLGTELSSAASPEDLQTGVADLEEITQTAVDELNDIEPPSDASEGHDTLVGALEGYLLLLNQNFIKDPYRDPAPNAFTKVFSDNLAEFEKQWKLGLERLEPDPWFTSVRHLQFVAAALKQFHAKKIEVKDWPHLKEQLIRHKFRATIRERDVVNRGERKEQVEDVEQEFDFPDPAEVEFLPSDNPKLPAGLLITNVTPNIRLTWSLNASGEIEENISYEPAPKIARKAVAKKSPPAIGQAKVEAPAKDSGERNQTQP